jgi:serine/threonine protein kinase
MHELISHNKQSNILVSAQCIARVADLGVTTVWQGTRSSTPTQGTSRWMSPELLSSECEPTFASDMWAFGVLLWEVRH